MKIRKTITLLGLLLAAPFIQAQSQNDPIFIYGADTVYADEFLRVFNKNRREEGKPSKEKIEEYLDLYVKFKLKVKEAYNRQMDTVPSFIRELEGYRDKLAVPYMTDKQVNEQLIKEAYERSAQEVNASHLLILCGQDASDEDTLKAYNKVINLRKRIVEGNQAFEDVAQQHSEDPSAKTNKGSLGYFTAFQMIYPFENAAYSLNVGEVSMPIRTQFGYHLVKVNDRRASVGDIQVGHIMIKFYNEEGVDSAKRRIDAVYKKLLAGEEWQAMVGEFSEDFSTSGRDGKLNYFNRTTSNIPDEFKDAAFSLTADGQFTAPVKTKYGWHIIKRFDLKPIKSFEEMRSSLSRKVERDSRSALNKTVVYERIKKENNFKEAPAAKYIQKLFNEKLLIAQYKAESVFGAMRGAEELFSINGKSYTDLDFAQYVEAHQKSSQLPLEVVVKRHYTTYVEEMNFAYENAILEEKYPDFKYIMQEYKEGILLFELMDQEVWTKAINDSVGLEQFYQDNIDKYMWSERAEVTFLSFKNAKTAKRTLKYMKKQGLKAALEKYNEKDPLSVIAETKYFEKGADELDGVEWAKGNYEMPEENGRVKYIVIHKITAPEAKPLNSNLGQVTSDYQAALETAWLNQLRTKYPVQIFEDNVRKLHQ